MKAETEMASTKGADRLKLFRVTLNWADSEGTFCENCWAPSEHEALLQTANVMAEGESFDNDESRAKWIESRLDDAGPYAAEEVETLVLSGLRELFAGPVATDGSLPSYTDVGDISIASIRDALVAKSAAQVAPSDEDADGVPQVRIIVGAEAAYVAINEPHYSLDVRLHGAMSAQTSLARHGDELRAQAAKLLQRARRIERAAMVLPNKDSGALENAAAAPDGDGPSPGGCH